MPSRSLIFFWTVFTFLPTSVALADEPYQNPQVWESLGYSPTQSDSLECVERPETETVDRSSHPWEPNSLAWPVEFQDPEHRLGNSMAEFQSYGTGPYYHGGLDLRVSSGAEVKTPVAGRIEAGHYGYSNHPDGSSTKYWRPWPASGSRTYFEVAVITEDGYRFEFHHINEDQLAPEVLAILRKGSGKINAGATLGRTIPWPDGIYHHLHYNILAPTQTQLNPEYYSPLRTTSPQKSLGPLLYKRTGPSLLFLLGSSASGQPILRWFAWITRTSTSTIILPLISNLSLTRVKDFPGTLESDLLTQMENSLPFGIFLLNRS